MSDPTDYYILNLYKALQDALDWIDAVPSDTILPVMPGFDRDDVTNLINETKAYLGGRNVLSASKATK